jgi:hypothetical protein
VNWYPYACPVCAGALHDDESDRRRAECLMCGRSFALVEILAVNGGRRSPIKVRALESSDGGEGRRILRAMLP